MSPIHGMEEFITATRCTHSFSELQKLCERFFEIKRIVMMAYHHLPPVGATDHYETISVISRGFPIEWESYAADIKSIASDPTPRKVVAATRPMWWSELSDMKGLRPDETAYLNALKQVDFGEGLAIPVFGPFSRNGYVAFGFGDKAPDLNDADVTLLQCCCQIAHQRYCELLYAETATPISLSRREHEILTWVARGKSNTVIAEIIGISPNTVVTFLRRTFAKLEVNDRVTAALRAMAIGELI